MERVVNFKYLFILLVLLCKIATSDVPRPRGVSLSRAALYNPTDNFTCLDGSLTIPFSQVNDDYCDCPDASDEPGTSACPHGIFHCTNAGHKSLNIAASRVNDGVCDCCDASDEYANKNSKCTNNCKDLGRSAREAAQKRAELLKAGKILRAELGEKGAQIKQQMKEKLTEFKKHREEAESVRLEKETLKKQIEELESAALQKYREIEEEEKRIRDEEERERSEEEAMQNFNKFDADKNGILEFTELQVHAIFDKDRNGEVSVDEAKFHLLNKDSVNFEEFLSTCWPNIKQLLLINQGLYKPPEPAHDIDEDIDGEEHHENENQEEAPEDGMGDDYSEGDVGEDEDEQTEEQQQEEPHHEETTPPPSPQYDEETQKLIDQANSARDAFNGADASVRDIQSEITKLEEYLSKDYGVDEEFASLQGQCFEFSDYEYIYRLCPFDKAIQQPKSGSSDTRLGVWSKWDGPNDNKYAAMLYDKGQSCWNGPTRSTKVLVTCGSENKITSVSEPNRCEYKFDFETPAACKEDPELEDVHDEL